MVVTDLILVHYRYSFLLPRSNGLSQDLCSILDLCAACSFVHPGNGRILAVADITASSQFTTQQQRRGKDREVFCIIGAFYELNGFYLPLI